MRSEDELEILFGAARTLTRVYGPLLFSDDRFA
jgi:hypothetical protein